MRKLIYTAVALALSAGVNAATLTQTANISSISIPQFADTVVGATLATQDMTRSLSFAQFNAATGVLTGVASELTFSGGSMTLSASGTWINGSPSFSSNNGSVTASSNLTGVTFNAINQTLSNSCTGISGCFPNGTSSNLSSTTSLTKTDNTWLSPTGTVSSANRNSYVGTDSITSTLTITASVNLGQATGIADPQARLSLTGLAGTQSLTYTYLHHANASFSGLADANSLSRIGMTAGNPIAFSVFALGTSSTTTRLDFVNVQCQGDCSAFSVTTPLISNLPAGSTRSGSATLVSSDGRHYAATYLLTYKDDNATGATASHLTNTLALNLESVAPVPEPGSWALLSLGLIGLAFRARKK